MTAIPAELAARIIDHLKGYGILIVSAEGAVTGWLGDAETITGYSAAEAIGMDFGALFTPSDRAVGADRFELERALAVGRAEDSRWQCRKNGERFWANGLTLPLGEAPTSVMKIFRDETALRRAEEQRILLLNELNHRVKNTLATVQSVAEQTLRSAGVSATVRDDLSARLIALSRAHNVLVDQNWAGADLDVIVRDVTRPYDRDPSPFRVEGPLARLHPSQAVTLSLVLHELVVNAVKYGALSTPTGRVTMDWNVALDSAGVRYLNLLWRESGGPPVSPPTRRGFGTRLIRSAFADQRGQAKMDYAPEGLSCALSLRLLDDLGVVDGAPDVSVSDAPDPADQQL